MSLTLVGDIGGTNSRIALAVDGNILRESVRKYKNEAFTDLVSVVKTYLTETDTLEISAIAMAVAGPVSNGEAIMTNLDWTIRSADLASLTTSQNVLLINDLQAQGFALSHIDAAHLVTLHEGREQGGTQLVMGMGTGFNAAAVFHQNGSVFVPPAEAGHGDIPCFTQEERQIVDWLIADHGHASVEDVLSGRGAVNSYAALKGLSSCDFTAHDILALAEAHDPCALAVMRVEAGLTAAVAANLAITLLTTGGVYIIGGFAGALEPYIDRVAFAQRFTAKGKFTEFTQSIPVKLVTDDFAALVGCAAALEMA